MTGKRKRETSSSPSPKRQKKCDDDPQTWTVVELRSWLRESGLSTGGIKSVLVERVTAAKTGDNPKENTTRRTSSRTSKKPKQESSDDELDMSSSEEEVQEKKPRRAPTRTTRKKAKKESSSEEEMDDYSSEDEPAPIKGTARTSARRAEKKQQDEDNPAKQWKQHGTILYYNNKESNDSGKIAAFDMDTTLIVPASGKTHPQGRSDWKWMFESVPSKLAELHNDGYKVVIISNQKGISTGNTTANAVQGKILDLEKDCGVPLSAILATSDDDYRKPSPKMFTFCVENMISVPVELNESFYIGDAAGRAAEWKPGKKKDFGCSDRKFAVNAGLKFQTPEEFFLGEDAVSFDWRSFNPNDLEEFEEQPYKAEDLISKEQEMILFVGFPASGKSTFAKNYLVPNGYVHVNRDTLSTQAKCLKATREAIAEGKSVVVDNTNPSPSVRASYIDIAEKNNIPVRCFHFQTSLELAQHLNNFREVISEGEQRHVPMVGYNMFKKHYQQPTKSEGFTEIKEIEFKRHHPDETHKILFQQWTERIR